MDERINIKQEMDDLLEAMYVLGRVDGMKEERLVNYKIKEDTFTRGFDAGHNAGYEEAMRDARVPDL